MLSLFYLAQVLHVLIFHACTPRPDDLYDLHDLYDLFPLHLELPGRADRFLMICGMIYLAHVVGWEPYNLHDLQL